MCAELSERKGVRNLFTVSVTYGGTCRGHPSPELRNHQGDNKISYISAKFIQQKLVDFHRLKITMSQDLGYDGVSVTVLGYAKLFPHDFQCLLNGPVMQTRVTVP